MPADCSDVTEEVENDVTGEKERNKPGSQNPHERNEAGQRSERHGFLLLRARPLLAEDGGDVTPLHLGWVSAGEQTVQSRRKKRLKNTRPQERSVRLADRKTALTECPATSCNAARMRRLSFLLSFADCCKRILEMAVDWLTPVRVLLTRGLL